MVVLKNFKFPTEIYIMKNSVPLLFALLCVIRAQPINENGEFELIDDPVVKADRTKDEIIKNHEFLPKQIGSVGGVGGITENEDQQLKSVPNIEKNEFGTMMLDAEATRQEHNKKADSRFGNLKSPESEGIQEKKKGEVSYVYENLFRGYCFDKLYPIQNQS